MPIFVAKHAGMCHGVQRAIRIAFAARDSTGSKIYSWGPLVHNEQVVKELEEKGIAVLEDSELPLSGEHQRPLIIRSHGIAPEKKEGAEKAGYYIIDATCPLVKRVQQIAKKLVESGYLVVVIGEAEHPEVEGILGWTNYLGMVCQNVKEARKIPLNRPLGIVVQTTQSAEKVKEIVSFLAGRAKEIHFYNTICPATQKRQQAASELARQVDVMLVIGGHHSGNTKRLAEVCREAGAKVYQIETRAEIQAEWFTNIDKVGITAGASTPEWIIEEVIEEMEDLLGKETHEQKMEEGKAAQEAQDYLHLYNDTFKDMNKGEFVKGVVIQKDEDSVMVDIGYKSEGKIPAREFKNLDEVKVGDEVEVYIVSLEDREGNVVLSKHKADLEKTWAKLNQALEEKEIIEGEVVDKVKGGLLVDVGIKGFLPASLVDRRFVSNLDEYLGRTIKVEVIEINRRKNKVVLSAKAVAEKEYEEAKRRIWESLEVGQVRKGVVKRLVDFGAFIDLGGAEGLLHVSELAWKRIKHPSEVLNVGDEVEVIILGIDKEKGRISLGYKQLKGHPWDNITERFQIGQTVPGKVVSIVPFGAFVSIADGLEGLVHISQLADRYVTKPDEVVKVGDMVEVKILDIDQDDKRISLSIKEANKPVQEAISSQEAEESPAAPSKTEAPSAAVEDIGQNA